MPSTRHRTTHHLPDPITRTLTSPFGYRLSKALRRPGVLVSMAVTLVSTHLQVSTLIFGLWAVASNWVAQAQAGSTQAAGFDAATISALSSVIASVATLLTATGALLARNRKGRRTTRHLSHTERAELVRTLLEDLQSVDEAEQASEEH